MDKDYVALVVSLIDCAAAVLFVAAVWVLHVAEGRVARTLDDDILTVKDYSVFVPNLPRDASVKDTARIVRERIEQVVNDRRFERKVYGWTTREDIRVADVVMSFKGQEKLILLMEERGQWLQKLELVLAKLLLLEDTLDFSKFDNAALFDKVIQERAKVRPDW